MTTSQPSPQGEAYFNFDATKHTIPLDALIVIGEGKAVTLQTLIDFHDKWLAHCTPAPAIDKPGEGILVWRHEENGMEFFLNEETAGEPSVPDGTRGTWLCDADLAARILYEQETGALGFAAWLNDKGLIDRKKEWREYVAEFLNEQSQRAGK